MTTRAPIVATYIRVEVCPHHGCPVIVMSDADGHEIAQSHLNADLLEDFISDLRGTAKIGEAMLRRLS